MRNNHITRLVTLALMVALTILLGVTPLDFSINGNVDTMRKVFEDAGIPVNCCAAMGESFDSLRHIFRASVNVVVSSCGRRLARYMEQTAGIPYVEGTPIGADGGAGGAGLGN